MSQINTFYVIKPSNFTELQIFKIYLLSISKIFAKSDNKVIMIVIDENTYTTDMELKLIMEDIIDKEEKEIILKFDKKILHDEVPFIQDDTFDDYRNPELIKDTLLSYNYESFNKYMYKITEHFIDLIQSFKKYINYEELFENKMNIMQQLTYKNIQFITLNLSTYNNIIMPDLYYIKALALIFNTLKIKKHAMENVRIVVCYDNRITDKAYDMFITNISKYLRYISKNNFISYKELNKFYSNLDNDAFIFNLNMHNFPTICSQDPNSLIISFLKEYHKTLEWDLYTMNVFSKKLFINTLITRSFGI